MNANLYARLRARFPADRAERCLETGDGREVSFAELEDGAGRIAALLGAIGVASGDRVAVQVEKSLQNVLLYLGCLQAGAVYLPLNTAYTGAEVGYFVRDAEPALVVCDPAKAAAVTAVAGGARVLTLGADGGGSLTERARGCAPLAEVATAAGDDVAAILYTSGTTGRAKGAMLSHDNLWSNAAILHRAWGFRPGDVLIHALPLYHTHGLFVALNLVLMNGGRAILMPKFDPERVIGLMARATVLMGVPTFYTRLLASPRLTRSAAAGMRLFVSGSAPMQPQTHLDFAARTGHRILERYGMTETGMNTSNPLDGERRVGTVGPALPGIEVRVCDAAGRVLPQGGTGVLEVRGRNVFRGYWRMPERTAAEFRPDGFFVTGDLARLDAEGYVTIVGRAKDLVITGGLNVYPKEVEAEIDALPGVLESAVIGVPHPDLGEAVVAVVVSGGDPGDVAAALRDRLAGFKLPRHVAILPELPRNSMGKVQKAALRERFGSLFES